MCCLIRRGKGVNEAIHQSRVTQGVTHFLEEDIKAKRHGETLNEILLDSLGVETSFLQLFSQLRHLELCRNNTMGAFGRPSSSCRRCRLTLGCGRCRGCIALCATGKLAVIGPCSLGSRGGGGGGTRARFARCGPSERVWVPPKFSWYLRSLCPTYLCSNCNLLSLDSDSVQHMLK